MTNQVRTSLIAGQVTTLYFDYFRYKKEMASEERKQVNELLDAKNLFNTLAAAELEAETDAFQCGRCKLVRYFYSATCLPSELNKRSFRTEENEIPSGSDSKRRRTDDNLRHVSLSARPTGRHNAI